MKKVLLVPGFRDNLHTHDYQKVLNVINKKGYDAEFVPIDWTRTTINEWVSALEDKYRNLNTKDTILAGFSFGAVTAFITAAKRNPSELWLFSLSSAFAEDMPPKGKSWFKEVGKLRTKEFARFKFKLLAQKIHCKTLLFIGEKEAKAYPDLRDRVYIANKIIPSSTIIKIPKTHHDITEEGYIKAIAENI